MADYTIFNGTHYKVVDDEGNVLDLGILRFGRVLSTNHQVVCITKEEYDSLVND